MWVIGEDDSGVLTEWDEDSRRASARSRKKGARKVSGTFLAQPPAHGGLVNREVVRNLPEPVAM